MKVEYRIAGSDTILSFEVEKPEDIDEDMFEEACNALTAELRYTRLAQPGTRNETAVNMLCAMRVIYPGQEADWYVDKAEELLGMCTVIAHNIAMMREHFERVAPYLDSWGPDGSEEDALDYMI